MVKAASEKARVVAEDQAREKAEAEKRKREQAAAGGEETSTPAEAHAANILGEEGRPLASASASATADDSIVSMLEDRNKNAPGSDQAGGNP
jgi:hypothetical protein